MKKILIFILSVSYASSVLASTSLAFENHTLTERSTTPEKYSLKIDYPQIKEPTNPAESQFNFEAKKWVKNQATQFKNTLATWNTSQLPDSVKANGSSLKITYQLTTLDPKILVSVRYYSENYLVGSAHPSHTYTAMNYDLIHNKALSLADLFSPNALYLNTISRIVTPLIQDKLKAKTKEPVEIFKEGLEPTAKNYETWNIVPNGLQFTFNEAEVAAYVYGPQEITLPFDKIKTDLLANSVLKNCLPPHHCEISQPILRVNKEGNSHAKPKP
jgi:hypothetical protein